MTEALVRGLAVDAYVSADAGAIEERIWRSAWVAVGYASDLARSNSFVTARVGATEIVVQRFGSNLRAFVNRCAHRGSCLHEVRRGERELRCRFHGWRYGEDGRPNAIPFATEAFAARALRDAEFHLDRLEVDVCGGVVFVSPGPSASLREYLGPLVTETLESIGGRLIDPFARETQTWGANWKVAVESVLESLHVPFLHRESFDSTLDPRASATLLSGSHSVCVTPLAREAIDHWRNVRTRLGIEPPTGVDPDTYTHLSVFPSFEVGITGGALVSTQIYSPIGTTRTELEFSLWLGDHEDRYSIGARSVLRAFRSELERANLSILAEDRAACESVQRTMTSSARPAILMPGEERIAAFHRAVGQYVGGGDA